MQPDTTDVIVETVFAYRDVKDRAYIFPMHSHAHAQLAFTMSGVGSFTTSSGSYILPPYRAIWIPSNMEHEVALRGAASFYVLYINPQLVNQPRDCRVFEVSGFVRALIEEVTKFDPLDQAGERKALIVQLLISEIGRLPSLPAQTALPRDERLLRVCREIMAEPADKRCLDYWADVACMGRRTFTRLFKQETGMSFATWRQQVRLLEAMSQLSAGQPVAAVAFDVGYESVSAFTTLFRRTFGKPPASFVASIADEPALSGIAH